MLKNECFIIKKMSFLKISDPTKRDAIVKEYLELKKNIRDNLLSERIGESELQTSLSKFYKPITETQKATTREITEGLKPIIETQKATAREITEGLRPIREGIEKLPETMKPIREGIEKLPEAMKPISETTTEEEEDYKELVGETAFKYLKKINRDDTFGIRYEKGHHYIGDKHVIVYDNDIIIKDSDKKLDGTDGLWELIMSKNPKNFTDMDYDNYKYLITTSNVLHRNNNPTSPYPRSSKSDKWTYLLSPIWNEITTGKASGKGVVVIPSDPNALLERLDLLLASQKAGHTGVRNELVSICDELKRQGVLDMKAYKKINHIIKK